MRRAPTFVQRADEGGGEPFEVERADQRTESRRELLGRVLVESCCSHRREHFVRQQALDVAEPEGFIQCFPRIVTKWIEQRLFRDEWPYVLHLDCQ